MSKDKTAPVIIGITGWKNAGKTTLLAKLTTHMTHRGYTVSSVKHAHHDVDVDQPNTDSYKHRNAGATEVMLATKNRFALMRELKDIEEPCLDELIARMQPVDIIFVEGFKHEASLPKILLVRDERDIRKAEDEQITNIIAYACHKPAINLSEVQYGFDIDEISDIADFIEAHFQIKAR